MKDAKNSPKIRHLGTIAQLCQAVSLQLKHISTIGKMLLNSNTSSTCPQNMVKFSALTVEIGSGFWGHPANFNGFPVLASLLQRRRSSEANQTLHDVSPSPGLLHYIYIFGVSCPDGILPRVKFTLRPSLASPILPALLHVTPTAGVSETLRRCTRNGITEL